MALLFSKDHQGTLYEVRSAGRSIRLYSNGVLHSQYNPNRLINGAIWDLLLLPAFLLPESPKRILLLGLGGGTLVHMIRHFFPGAHITCVELDKQHIHIAKKWFKLPKDNIEVVHGDAYDFLKKGKNSKQQFDWIVDDVFQHVNGEPERGFAIDKLLPLYKGVLPNKKQLALLSLNVIGSHQKKQFKTIMDSFSEAYDFRHPLYENHIMSLLQGPDQGLTKAQYQLRLNDFKELDTRYKTCPLNYGFKRLK